MILIFDPEPPFLKYCQVKNKSLSKNKIEFKPEWHNNVIKSFDDIKDVKAIGYVLYHGGEYVKNTVSVITPELVDEIGKSMKFLPDYNDVTFKTIKYWIEKLPEIQHILFCETAFFVNLPLEAATYAVPYKLREKGIRRFGGYGLYHLCAYEQIQSNVKHSTQNLISVYLGNHTNVVGIKSGKPVETSIGFTPVEGILSSTSCGDIDPTIIFQLYFSGISFDEINKLLTYESGFSAILGKRCGFLDVVRNQNNPEFRELLEIYCYQLIKYLGAFISVLGGIDAVVFSGENVKESIGLILKICDMIEFLGIKCNVSQNQDKKFSELSNSDSMIKVFLLNYSKFEIISEKIEILLKKES